MVAINTELRAETYNRLETFAKLLVSGAKVNYTLQDIKKDMYKKYLNSLRNFHIPGSVKRKIAKETLETDFENALREIQNDNRI
jgi:DNA polymerase II small subunit/DNA polymerase delta subunit B